MSSLRSETHLHSKSDTGSALTIGAIGDLHIGKENLPRNFHSIVNQECDLLLIAGDLTDYGKVDEIHKLDQILNRISVPTVAVLGNRDSYSGNEDLLKEVLEKHSHVYLLDGDYQSFSFEDMKVGIVGTRGCGGGLDKDTADVYEDTFSEPLRREVASINYASGLMDEDTPDVRIALLHYLPYHDNLGETFEGMDVLQGNVYLGGELDKHNFALTLHGHAHRGVGGLLSLSHRKQLSNVAQQANDHRISCFRISSGGEDLRHELL